MSENGQAEPLLVAERVRKVCRTGGVEVEALAGLDLAVRPRTAIIPATVVAILVTSAGMAYLRAMLTGQVSLDWGSGPTLLWPVWELPWAPLLPSIMN